MSSEEPRPAPAAAEAPETAADRDRRDVAAQDGVQIPAWLDTWVQYTWRTLVLLAGLATALYVLSRIYLVSLPVIIALILSTLCVPPARRLERRGFPRLAAALVVVLGGIGSVAAIIALLTPSFISQLQDLGPTTQEGVDQLLLWLEEGPLGYDRQQLEDLWRTAMNSLEGAAGSIATQIGSVAVAIVEAFTALALAIVLLFFFVKDGEQIVRWLIRRVPDRHQDDVRAASARGWVALSGFVRGTAAVALIDALGIGIGLLLLDVPLVLPLSVLVFFGAFVPVIGAFVTGLLAALVALAHGGLATALIVTGIVLLVQQVESNLLQPTIMRRAVALHPVVVLAVLTAGAVLIGIIGAFLAVPVTAVVAAAGNELRLRHELRRAGHEADATPIGGPGVDPETVRAQFPEDTRLRAAARRRGAERERGRRRRRRTRTKVDEDGNVESVTVTGPQGPPAEPGDNAAAGPDTVTITDGDDRG
ncbi:MAG: AI-2E family transporter [Nitriliruptoraceae bacterium]